MERGNRRKERKGDGKEGRRVGRERKREGRGDRKGGDRRPPNISPARRP